MLSPFEQGCLVTFFIFQSFWAFSQEKSTVLDFENHFRISPVLSHTYIPKATIGGKEIYFLPSFGLDLEYWFSHKWGVGLHNDLELESFEIEKDNAKNVRVIPIVSTIDLLYNFHKRWVLVLGAGIEFDKRENLTLFRTGIEYEIEIGDGWDVSPTIFYDIRISKFDTASIGIGFGKRF